VLSQRRPSWPRPCAATGPAHTSSRLAAWTWPTRHCASWPGGWWRDRRGGRVRHHPTHVEDYKVWLAAQPGCTGPTLAKNTQRQRLRMIRIFFERLIEWDWPEAHHRNPILQGTSHPVRAAAPSSSLTRMQPNCWPQQGPPPARYRLVVEMLSRTGMRQPSSASWRPTQSRCATGPTGCASRRQAAQRPHDPAPRRARPLLEEWTARNRVHIGTTAPHGRRAQALDRRTVHRIVATTAKKAGIGHAHPTSSVTHWPPGHQPGHALGDHRRDARHRSMDMTLVYAGSPTGWWLTSTRGHGSRRALQDGGAPTESPAEAESPAMTAPPNRYARMLATHVQPTGELDCRIESACESARTSAPTGVRAVLLRQLNHPVNTGRRSGRPLREAGQPSDRGVGLTRITCITPGWARYRRTVLAIASCRRPARLGHPSILREWAISAQLIQAT